LVVRLLVTTLPASSMLQAAAEVAGDQHYPQGALYVVATPIGNLADISLRAVHVLGLVDAIACEDTRHSAPLLRRLGLEKPLIALHQHNERAASAAVLERLARGERVACISDAGTPAISDPGADLVAAARAAGHRVVPIPGASSLTAALSASGDAAGSDFLFVGFLPSRGKERALAIERIAAQPMRVVVLEAPHRIGDLADGLARLAPARTVTVCRELTKQFEGIDSLSAADFPAWLAGDPHRRRGEFVVVLHALAAPSSMDAADAALGVHDKTLRALSAALPLKQAVAIAAELTGVGRNDLYARALALKRMGNDVDDFSSD
jgi:16S rRNA (cytidine1402-2'-O)-methyltransferase